MQALMGRLLFYFYFLLLNMSNNILIAQEESRNYEARSMEHDFLTMKKNFSLHNSCTLSSREYQSLYATCRC